MTTTDEKKTILTMHARKKLSEKLVEYNTQHLPRAQLKHWTFGEDHKPFADEIIVNENGHTRIILGIRYDDKGHVGELYRTDENGKQITIPFSSEMSAGNESDQISKRIDEAKKEAKAKAKPQPKTAEKAPVKAPKRVIKKTAPVTQSERLS